MISRQKHHWRRPQGLALVMALSGLLAGCSPAATELTPHLGATSAPGATPALEARSARPREIAPQTSGEDLAALAAGNQNFAFDLYQAVRGEDGNLFYSPYSLSLALAMTYAGARGTTEAEMAETLHFTLPQAQLHPAFNGLDLALTDARDDAEAFELSLANAVWGQQGFDFTPEFLDALAVNYGAGLRLADFVDPSQRDQARQTINTWVSDETEGRIEDLLPEGILNADTRLVLANAIYFKADWETPFAAEATMPMPFTLADGSQLEVPTMSRRASTGYAASEDVELMEMYYKGGRASMVILLPAPGEFEAFEASLDAQRVEALTERLEPGDLQLYLPKFEYAASLDLGATLADLGMPSAFDPNAADFSVMDGRRDLYLTSVVHKAFVAVDEKGTEAAAATGVVAGATSMPQVVMVDRPFIYLIRDSETGTVLFVGRVVNPAD